MSIRVMTLVWDHYPREAGDGEFLLALAIADWADDKGGNVFPFVREMVDKTRSSKRAVQRNIGKMLERGWLEIVEPGGRGGTGRTAATTYRIPVEKVLVAAQQEKAPSDGRGANLAPPPMPPVAPPPCHQWHPPRATSGTPLYNDVSTPVSTPTNARERAGEQEPIAAAAPQQELMPPAPMDAAGYPLPEWVDIPTWDAWMDVRKSVKARNTPMAKKLLLRAIDTLREQGHDATAVIEQSIRCSWKDAYPLKATGDGNGKSATDRQVALLTGR